MSDTERMDDAQFVHQVLASLPTTAVPAALEARLMADFDRLAARQRAGVWRRIGDHLWPGVPAWKPVSVLAASLAMGLMAGIFVPSPATTTAVAAAASDTTVVAALDTVPEMGMDREP